MGNGLLRSATALCFLALACDSSNPVAPTDPQTAPAPAGTFEVALSADPGRLQAGSAEPATITVNVRRASDGRPPADGTRAVLNTNLGNFGVEGGEPVTLVDLELLGGRAEVSFFAGDEAGTATLLSEVGDSFGQLALSILEVVPPSFFLLEVQPNVGNPEGNEMVTIQGEGFKEPLRVSFASTLAQVVEVTSSRTILVITPPAPAPVGAGETLTVDVTVTNSLDLEDPPTATLPGGFTYSPEAPPPFFLLAVAPPSGSPDGGETVTVTGGGFQAPLRVELAGTPALSATRLSDTEIRAVTPASTVAVGAGESRTVDVTVVNALDQEAPPTATLTNAFTYDGGPEPPPPTPVAVSSLAPNQGPYQGGTLVTVTGQGFESPVAVELGGVTQLAATVLSATSVRFTTAGVAVTECPGNGLLPQTGVTVTNLGSGESGSANLGFTYTVPVPRISRVSPSFGPQLGNTLVTVEGQGFADPVRVVFSRDGQAFAAVVGSVAVGSIQVTSPRVPDSFFPEADCVTGEGDPGKRSLEAAADVGATNQATGCADTFASIFTYRPTDAGCRPVPAAGSAP